MTAPTTARQDWLRWLRSSITATKAALDGARAAYEHSPNHETQRAMERVERELDRLLDQLPRPRDPEAVAEAIVREMPSGRMAG